MKAERAILAKLSKPMKSAKARALVSRVAARFKVRGSLMKAGKGWRLVLKVNPTEEEKLRGGNAEDVEKKGKAAKKKASSAKKQTKEGRREAGRLGREKGLEHEEARAAELAAKEGSTRLPTRRTPGPGETKEKGRIDVALHQREQREEVEVPVVELGEIKKTDPGRGFKTLGTMRSGRKPAQKRGELIEVGPGRGAAAERVRTEPEVARKVGTGKAALKRGSKAITNYISAITENLRGNVKRIFELLESADTSQVSDDVKREVRQVLSGKGGVLRFFIDLKKGVTISENQAEAAAALIQAAFDDLFRALESVETKIETVIRRADEDEDLVKK